MTSVKTEVGSSVEERVRGTVKSSEGEEEGKEKEVSSLS